MKLCKTFGVIAAQSVALAVASPAQADQWSFLNYVSAHGVPYSSPSDMIALGSWVCSTIRNSPYGNTPAIEGVPTPTFLTITGTLSSLGYGDAAEKATIIMGAITHMCEDARYKYFNLSPGGPPPTFHGSGS